MDPPVVAIREQEKNVWESSYTIRNRSDNFFWRMLDKITGNSNEEEELKYFGSIKPIYEVKLLPIIPSCHCGDLHWN